MELTHQMPVISYIRKMLEMRDGDEIMKLINEAIEKAGLSKAELARRLDIPGTSQNKNVVITRVLKSPNLEEFPKLFNALDLSPDDLFKQQTQVGDGNIQISGSRNSVNSTGVTAEQIMSLDIPADRKADMLEKLLD